MNKILKNPIFVPFPQLLSNERITELIHSSPLGEK